MASHAAEQTGDAASKAPGQVKNLVGDAADKAAAAVDSKRAKVADAIDNVADAVGERGKTVPEPGKRYSRAAKDKLREAADYVRDNDAEEMGRDARDFAREYPIGTLLVLGAVVIGGSMLVAAMIEGDGSERRPTTLKSAANGLGPKGAETLTRIRDAAFSYVMAKAVDAAEEVFPGFRGHFEKA